MCAAKSGVIAAAIKHPLQAADNTACLYVFVNKTQTANGWMDSRAV